MNSKNIISLFLFASLIWAIAYSPLFYWAYSRKLEWAVLPLLVLYLATILASLFKLYKQVKLENKKLASLLEQYKKALIDKDYVKSSELSIEMIAVRFNKKIEEVKMLYTEADQKLQNNLEDELSEIHRILDKKEPISSVDQIKIDRTTRNLINKINK